MAPAKMELSFLVGTDSPPASPRPCPPTSAMDSLAAAAAFAAAAVVPTAIPASPRPATPSESSASTSLSAEFGLGPGAVALAVGGSGPHACPKCGTGFAQKLRLLHHLCAAHGILEHAGKKIISCGRCDAAFLRNTDLKKHELCVHEKRRPHACEARGCESRFFFAKDLKKHISTVHERNKPFACPRCAQRFGKREHMTSHVRRVHEKLKPYACTLCKLPLASKYNLQGHLRTISHRARVLALQKAVAAAPLVVTRPGKLPTPPR